MFSSISRRFGVRGHVCSKFLTFAGSRHVSTFVTITVYIYIHMVYICIYICIWTERVALL